jgi:hypothetical protein
MFGLNNRNDAKEIKGGWWQLLKLGFTPTKGKQLQILLILINAFFFTRCNHKNKYIEKDEENKLVIIKTNKERIFKLDNSEFKVSTTTNTVYINNEISKYIYKDICDSIKFIYDYKDTIISGFPVIMAIWDKIKNDTLKIEFEFARPPYVDYQYYINDAEIYFESDSITSFFHKAKINKNDSLLFIKCVFYKNGKKWKTFRRKQPI